MKLELVTWDDAVACGGWENLGQGDKPHRCTSIGVVTVDEPTHIVVAGTWASLDGVTQTNNRITIPRGFIVSREALDLAALRGKTVLKPSKARMRKPKISAWKQFEPFK